MSRRARRVIHCAFQEEAGNLDELSRFTFLSSVASMTSKSTSLYRPCKADLAQHSARRVDILARSAALNTVRLTSDTMSREAPPWANTNYNRAYSAFAALKVGRSESAVFQRPRKSAYATFALTLSPDNTRALASSRCARAPMGSLTTSAG
jgi:hypothetical protein